MTIDINGVQTCKLTPELTHIACPACGKPLHTNGEQHFLCQGCGQLWQSLGIDYRQGSDVLRLQRADGVSAAEPFWP